MIPTSPLRQKFYKRTKCLELIVDLPIEYSDRIVERELTLVINHDYPYPFNPSPYSRINFPNMQRKICTPNETSINGFTAPKDTRVTATLVSIRDDGERLKPSVVTILLKELNRGNSKPGEFNIRAIREIDNTSIWSIGCWHYLPRGPQQDLTPNPLVKQAYVRRRPF